MLKTNPVLRPFVPAILFLGVQFQNCSEAGFEDNREKDENIGFSMLGYNDAEKKRWLGTPHRRAQLIARRTVMPDLMMGAEDGHFYYLKNNR